MFPLCIHQPARLHTQCVLPYYARDGMVADTTSSCKAACLVRIKPQADLAGQHPHPDRVIVCCRLVVKLTTAAD
jgi:hypothetical protein